MSLALMPRSKRYEARKLREAIRELVEAERMKARNELPAPSVLIKGAWLKVNRAIRALEIE